MSLADTIMVGRLGVVPLAAATFANNVLYVPFIFGLGILMAVSIRVSQARGANNRKRPGPRSGTASTWPWRWGS